MSSTNANDTQAFNQGACAPEAIAARFHCDVQQLQCLHHELPMTAVAGFAPESVFGKLKLEVSRKVCCHLMSSMQGICPRTLRQARQTTCSAESSVGGLLFLLLALRICSVLVASLGAENLLLGPLRDLDRSAAARRSQKIP